MNVFVVILLVVITLIFIIIYNSIIYRKNQVDNAFAGIDTMLKKRYDLIPALTEAVKAYMAHEKEILTKITEIRTLYLSDQEQSQKVIYSDILADQMKNFFIVAENYPQLKANENFLKLQAAWNEMEDQVAAARRFYNSAVNDYHNSLEMFPSNLLARLMKLKHRQYFSLDSGEKELSSE